MATKKKKTTATDPLEEAKMDAPDAVDAPPADRSEDDTAEVKVPKHEPAPAAPPPEPPKSVERPEWEVQKKITISWGKQMLTLQPGTRIGVHTHGPGCVKKMRDAGVALKAKNMLAEQEDAQKE